MKKINLELEIDENDLGSFNIYDVLTSQVGKPFDVPVWPRGKNSPSKRAEILLKAGILSLRGWNNSPKPYRIMAFDGGGIRGIMSAAILVKLDESLPGFAEKTDLLAGTSTGAIIVGLIAIGMGPRDVLKLYKECGRITFKDTFIDDVKDLGKAVGADYTLKNLKVILEREIGRITLGELNRKVLIPAFQLDSKFGEHRTWKPKIQHNTRKGDDDNNIRLVDAILRSIAAPSYFPTYQGFIDGGVCANNPSICAIVQALSPAIGAKLDAIHVLSFGTGNSLNYISGDKDWGVVQWAKPLVEMLTDTNMGMAEFESNSLIGERYVRLNAVLKRHISLDDHGKMDELIRVSESVDLTKAKALIREKWN